MFIATVTIKRADLRQEVHVLLPPETITINDAILLARNREHGPSNGGRSFGLRHFDEHSTPSASLHYKYSIADRGITLDRQFRF